MQGFEDYQRCLPDELEWIPRRKIDVGHYKLLGRRVSRPRLENVEKLGDKIGKVGNKE